MDAMFDIFDSLDSYFEDCEETRVEIYRQIANMTRNDVEKLKYGASRILIDMDRCPFCGERYKYADDTEYHSEVDAYEHKTIRYCHNGCDE